MIRTDTSAADVAKTWMYGVFRGLGAQVFLYPLEVIKTNQQMSEKLISGWAVTRQIWKDFGVKGFTQGFAPQLAKVLLRQGWWWPVIIYFPPLLSGYQVSPLMQQAITGVAVASVDTVVNSPLDRVRILLSTGKKRDMNFASFFRDGWQGAGPYWKKESVKWAAFLMGQHYFRKHLSSGDGKPLSLFQIAQASFYLSFIANIAISPLDVITTLKQGKKLSILESAHREKLPLLQILQRMYRGFPLNFTMTMLQITATVFLIDWLEVKK